MKSYDKIKRTNPFTLLNIFIYILSAICLMVYTTQQSHVHADEDLGYDIKSANASVTVGTACTFTATVDSAHSANISNGIYGTDIGKTTLNTVCNDSGGYAIYAIGFSNDKYGATDLSSDISSTYDISTGTNTSGDSSSWAMKLASEPGTTTATIENGYDNYNIVPDDYTKVATLNTVTDPGSTTSATGSSVSTTYQTYISPTQPAGTYTGKVKYTLVHPSTAPAPEKPVTIADAFKKSGATKTTQGYYKMQDMTPEINSRVDIISDSLQVQDIRDDKIYWITKLADGNIWMTQNLDHDIVAGKTYTSADTDLPEGTTWRPSTSTRSTDDTSWNGDGYTSESYDPGDIYLNRELTTRWNGTIYNMTTATGDPHYHIGNYYNWYAAIARNSEYFRGEASQSICPAGWRLPSYSSGDVFQSLITAQSLTSGLNGNIQNSPTLFIYGGFWDNQRTHEKTTNSYSVGSRGHYWSSMSPQYRGTSYGLHFDTYGDLETMAGIYQQTGLSVRCVAR